MQISKYAIATHQLFRYSNVNNGEELARMVAVEHLLFNFGEKISFVNYCQKALNPSACCIHRSSLIGTFFNLYRKSIKKINSIF